MDHARDGPILLPRLLRGRVGRTRVCRGTSVVYISAETPSADESLDLVPKLEAVFGVVAVVPVVLTVRPRGPPPRDLLHLPRDREVLSPLDLHKDLGPGSQEWGVPVEASVRRTRAWGAVVPRW